MRHTKILPARLFCYYVLFTPPFVSPRPFLCTKHICARIWVSLSLLNDWNVWWLLGDVKKPMQSLYVFSLFCFHIFFGNSTHFVLILFSVEILTATEMDTLSSLMEVKLDIREKRTEWLPLRVSLISGDSSWIVLFISWIVFIQFSPGLAVTSRLRRSSVFRVTWSLVSIKLSMRMITGSS